MIWNAEASSSGNGSSDIPFARSCPSLKVSCLNIALNTGDTSVMAFEDTSIHIFLEDSSLGVALLVVLELESLTASVAGRTRMRSPSTSNSTSVLPLCTNEGLLLGSDSSPFVLLFGGILYQLSQLAIRNQREVKGGGRMLVISSSMTRILN